MGPDFYRAVKEDSMEKKNKQEGKQGKAQEASPLIYLGPPVRKAGLSVHLEPHQIYTAMPRLPKGFGELKQFFVPVEQGHRKAQKAAQEQWGGVRAALEQASSQEG